MGFVMSSYARFSKNRHPCRFLELEFLLRKNSIIVGNSGLHAAFDFLKGRLQPFQFRSRSYAGFVVHAGKDVFHCSRAYFQVFGYLFVGKSLRYKP